jgi:hypothetical protein
MGRAEGAAPDSRGLPEWVEFKWQEIPPELQAKEGQERCNGPSRSWPELIVASHRRIL